MQFVTGGMQRLCSWNVSNVTTGQTGRLCFSLRKILFRREFVEKTFNYFDRTIYWENKGINEKGFDQETGKMVVRVDSEFFRPSEVDQLLGDPSKAMEKLGWTAATSIEELIQDMVSAVIGNNL